MVGRSRRFDYADPLARRSASTAATRHKGLRILYRWLAEEMRSRHSMARIRAPIPTLLVEERHLDLPLGLRLG
jgi:hypothetical protein